MGDDARVRECGMIGGPALTLFEAAASIGGAIKRLLAFAIVLGVAVGLLFAIGGCASRAHTLVKPETVTVPVFIYKPLPAELTRACVVQPLAPACTRNGKPELCNDQLLYERNAYRTELQGCDSDKTEIRKLQPAQP